MMSLLDLTSNFSGGLPMPTNLSRAAVINQMSQGTSAPTAMDNSCGEDQQPPTKKSKKQRTKRVRNEMNHKAKLRKFLRNTGQEYISTAGKVVKAKAFEDRDCGCSKRCNTKVPADEREKCFEKFWKTGDYSKQNIYLNGLVTREEVKQHRPRANVQNRGPKGVTYQYRINVGRITRQVCKVFFLETFMVSPGRLFRALRKDENERDPGEDLRGRRPPSNKTPPEIIQRVRDHINSFPRYDFHYTQNPKGKFLKSDLNVKRMYAMYLEECQYRNLPCVKENMYRKTFNNEFHLTFLSPRNDPCPSPKPQKPRNLNRTPRKKREDMADDRSATLVRPLDHPVPMRPSQNCNVPQQNFCSVDNGSQSSSTLTMTGHPQEKDSSKTTQTPIYNFSPAACQALLSGAGPPFYPQDQTSAFHNQAPNFFSL